MQVLILGNSQDAHAARVKQELSAKGYSAHYLDTNLFPTSLSISWQPDSGEGYLHLTAEDKLAFKDVLSVYWRNLASISIPDLSDATLQRTAYNDSMSLLRTLVQALPARWVNSWAAYQFHKDKPLQLHKAAQLGVSIPVTLISNNPEEIRQFAQSQPQLIFKPVTGGVHTQWVTESLLEIERLKKVLSFCPVTLQEYIPGTNIRTYVIGESVYSAEIATRALDFRSDEDAQLIPVELPPAIKEQSIAIANAFFLEWTGIDWRRKPTGEYIFLEANPSPMFLHFENKTGFPLTQELVNLLIS